MAPCRAKVHESRNYSTDLSKLPPELSVAIISRIRRGASKVPLVSRDWRALFAVGAPTEPSFREVSRQRYGIRKLPRWSTKPEKPLSWGHVYLALSSESCHLCSNNDICYGAFAVTAAFSSLMSSFPLTLFPVCSTCFLRDSDPSMPIVVNVAAIPDLFVHISSEDLLAAQESLAVVSGLLYSAFRSAPKRCTTAGREHGSEHSPECLLQVVHAKSILKQWPLLDSQSDVSGEKQSSD